MVAGKVYTSNLHAVIYSSEIMCEDSYTRKKNPCASIFGSLRNRRL